MLRRSLFGPRFKANSLSISGQRKNPARPPKLRDVKKQVKAVQESYSPVQLEKEEEAKDVQESQSPIKLLKEEEAEAKDVQESQSPIQLEKEEEAKVVQESQSPIKLLKEEEEHCEVCAGAAGSHPSTVCPYLHHVPWHIMSVGNGYKIACRFCWKGENCVHHLTRYAIRLRCMGCEAVGIHTTRDCPERQVKGILMPSVRRVRVTTTFHTRARHPLLPQRIGTFSHPLLHQSGHARYVFE